MTTKTTIRNPETQARLNLEKARADITTWTAEIARLETEILPTPEDPSELSAVSAQRAVQLQQLGAARDALTKAEQQVRAMGWQLLPFAADRYRATAKREAKARESAHDEWEAALDRVAELMAPGARFDWDAGPRRALPLDSQAEREHERAQFLAERNAAWIDAVIEKRKAFGKTLEESLTDEGRLWSNSQKFYIGARLEGAIPGDRIDFTLGDGYILAAAILPPELLPGGLYPVTQNRG